VVRPASPAPEGASLVASIVGPTNAIVRRRLRAAAPWADLLEIRLDRILEPDVEGLVRHCPRPAIATCRRVEDGGAFSGTEATRLGLLRRAADAGATFVDLELDVLEGPERVEARILGSLHDLHGMPDDLEGLAGRIRDAGADLVKVVGTAHDVAGAVRILDLLAGWSGEVRLAAHAMGDAGRFTRLVGPRLGSALVYASGSPGREAAPGQPSIRELREVLRTHRIRRSTALYAVLGRDVSRSPSPAVHNAAFEALGLDAAYLPISCEDPSELLRRLPEGLFAGFSVTMPHKETLLPSLDEVSETAARIGAVNTLVREPDGRWRGENTDAPGILDAFARAGVESIEGATAVVVGAGGAARAAAEALRVAGAEVTVTARSAERARRLAADLGIDAAAVGEVPWERATLVVQATPLGTRPDDPLPLEPARLAAGTSVLDVVAVPPETPLLRAVRERGGRAVSGASMFVAQAERQVGLWTGRPAPAGVLAAAFDAHVARLRPIVLVGLRGAGKTTVGERLAERLGRRFLDSDALVSEGAGRTPAEVIREDGVEAFRTAEAQAVAEALSSAASVVALGGGAVEDGATRRLLRATSTVVWLDAPDEALLARAGDVSTRPPLTTGTPEEEVAELRARREPWFRDLAAFRVVTAAGGSPGETAREVHDALRARAGGPP
jgi:3-dehydroquinate dehydratase/shikimate dehydrogenase